MIGFVTFEELFLLAKFHIAINHWTASGNVL